jgi:hypothetical protein
MFNMLDVEYTDPLGQGPAHFGQSIAWLPHDGGVGFAVGAPDDLNGDGSVRIINRVAPDGTITEGLQRSGLNLGLDPAAFGSALVAADFNQDGLTDLAIGAPLYDTAILGQQGAVFLHPGVPDESMLIDPVPIELDNPDGPVAGIGGRFGAALAAADWNGDGVPDLVVGAPGTPKVWVFLGAKQSNNLIAQNGQAVAVYGGVALALDNIDADNLADLVTSDPLDGTVFPEGGKAYVQTHGGFSAGFDADPPSSGAHMGSALASLGDVTHDLLADFAIGAEGFDAGIGAEGQVCLFVSGTPALSLYGTLPWSGPEGSAFGASVATLGDFLSNGRTELLVGAPGYATPQDGVRGGAFVYDVTLDKGTPPFLFEVPGPRQAGSRFGAAIAGGADLDGDGRPDFIVGAPSWTFNGVSEAGRVFIYLSSSFSLDGGESLDGGPPAVDGGVLLPDGGTTPNPDAGAPDAGPSDGGSPDGGQSADGGTALHNYDFNTCGCHAGGGAWLALLVPMRRRARAGRGSSRTPAPSSSAPPRS